MTIQQMRLEVLIVSVVACVSALAVASGQQPEGVPAEVMAMAQAQRAFAAADDRSLPVASAVFAAPAVSGDEPSSGE